MVSAAQRRLPRHPAQRIFMDLARLREREGRLTIQLNEDGGAAILRGRVQLAIGPTLWEAIVIALGE